MNLEILHYDLSICKLDSDKEFPSWAKAGNLWSITKTSDELSVVCETSHIPVGVNSNPNWRALKVQGLLDFSLVRIMGELSTTLAKAQVSLFAISTFDTDYLLVKDQDLTKSINALKSAGQEVSGHAEG